MPIAVLCAAALVATLTALAACGDEVPIPPRSLSSPWGLATARTCAVVIDGVDARVDPSRCGQGAEFPNGGVSSLGLITNRERESAMLVSLESRIPTLLNVSRAEPGVSGIVVCAGPGDMATTSDGNFAVITCDVARALSIVSVPTQEERLRLPRGVVELGLVSLPGGSRFALARPDSQSVVIEELTFDCDGQSDIFPRGCEPEVELTQVAEVGLPGRAAHLVAVTADQLYVAYQDQAFLSRVELADDAQCLEAGAAPPCETLRIGLSSGCNDGIDNDGDNRIDRADRQCFGPNDAESPDGVRAPVTACTDAVDNDGDGFIDHDDVDCMGALDDNEGGGVLPIACSDGIDNDADGLTDADDPECIAPQWPDEAVAPACGDGIDNDADGDIDFPDDADCADGLWDSESDAPECSDGIDNDADGATDFPDDTDCAGPLGRSEEESVACSNGEDDDGDGFTDEADPQCNGPRDDDERAAAAACGDGADNDEDGLTDLDDPDCYGVTGSTEAALSPDGYGPIGRHVDGDFVLVSDPIRHQVLLVDLEQERLIDAGADDFLHPGLGLPLSSSGLIGPSIGYEGTLVRALLDDRTLTRVEQRGVVPTSDGAAAVISYGYLARTEGGADDPIEVTVAPLLQPRDGLGDDAVVSDFGCELPDDYRATIRGLRGPDAILRVACEDEEVPKIVDTGDDLRVQLITKTDARTDAEGLLSEVTVPFDWRLRDETWTLTYEGLVPNTDRNDGLVDQDIAGLIVSDGANFCNLGIEVGDRFIADAPSPAPGVDPEACAAFRMVTLEWEIAFRRADALYLATVPETGFVTELPNRSCFAEGFTYEVRASGEWLVTGSISNLIHNQTGLSEQCVPATGDVRRTGRVADDEVFENVFFTFGLESGTVPQVRDTALTFFVQNNFALTALNTGPFPRTIDIVPTVQGTRLWISDSGVNTVFVFDANSLLALVNLI